MILCSPHRVSYIHRRREADLHDHVHLRLNAAKTAVRNQKRSVPAGLAGVGILSEAWLGDPALPSASRGVVVIGVLLGTLESIDA